MTLEHKPIQHPFFTGIYLSHVEKREDRLSFDGLNLKALRKQFCEKLILKLHEYRRSFVKPKTVTVNV